MDKKEVLKMLKEEIAGKVDAETLKKLKGAKSSKEALSILESASVTLSDEMLEAVAGGNEDSDSVGWVICQVDECNFDGLS